MEESVEQGLNSRVEYRILAVQRGGKIPRNIVQDPTLLSKAIKMA